MISTPTCPQTRPLSPLGQPETPWLLSAVEPFGLHQWTDPHHLPSTPLPFPTPVSVQTEAQSTYYHYTTIHPHIINDFKEMKHPSCEKQWSRTTVWESPVHGIVWLFKVRNKPYLHIEVEVVCWLHEAVVAFRLLRCNSKYKQFFWWQKIIEKK